MQAQVLGKQKIKVKYIRRKVTQNFLNLPTNSTTSSRQTRHIWWRTHVIQTSVNGHVVKILWLPVSSIHTLQEVDGSETVFGWFAEPRECTVTYHYRTTKKYNLAASLFRTNLQF